LTEIILQKSDGTTTIGLPVVLIATEAVVLVFVAELSFGSCFERTPLLLVCFELGLLAGRAAFLVRGLATASAFSDVDDPDEQAVAVSTNATTNGKDNFFNFMNLLIGVPLRVATCS
jgi:hypothetical protein